MPDRPRRKPRRPAPASRPWLPVVIVLAVGAAALGLLGFVVARTFKQMPEIKLDDDLTPTAGGKTPAERAASALPTLAPVARFTTGISKTGRVQVSADGSRVMVGTALGVPGVWTEVWDAGTPRLVRRFEAHTAYLSTDGRRLLAPRERAAGWDFVDLDGGGVVQVARLPGSVLGFSAPDRVVVAGLTKGGRFTVNVVDTRTWAAVGPAFDVPTTIEYPIRDLTTDGRHLVVAEPDGPKFSVWDVTTGARVGGATAPGAESAKRARLFRLTPDATRVVAERAGKMRDSAFDVATGREVADLSWVGSRPVFLPGREVVLGYAPLGEAGRAGGRTTPGRRRRSPTCRGRNSSRSCRRREGCSPRAPSRRARKCWCGI